MERKSNLNFFLSFALITVVFIIGSIRIMHLPAEEMQAGRWVTHTHEVLLRLEALSWHLEEAEVGKRDYIFTSDPQYQALFNSAVSRISEDLTDFQHLTQDNALQQNRIPPLKKNIDEKVAELKKADDQLGSVGSVEAFKTLVNSHDMGLTRQINQQIAEMKSEEGSLLQIRLQSWYAEATDTQEYFIISGALLYIMICAMFGMLYHQHQKIMRIEQAAAALRRDDR